MIPVADILAPIENAAEAVLNFFHDNVGLSWGMSIIALTIPVRALLIPLTYRQIKGMRAMQALQPKIKEIQEKYKNDRQRMQQEMMRFYQENKVNPLASCIPLLAQLPVFFALFRRAARHELPKTSTRSGHAAEAALPLHQLDLTAKAHGAELIVLLVLYVGTRWLVSGMVRCGHSPTGKPADDDDRLPSSSSPFFINFPAGLSPLLDHDQLLDDRPSST